MDRLSAAMIVKDEEELLPACLESIEGIPVVIVDTGSTDNTIQIARDHGATVYEHQWVYDFSFHRNQSFNYAETPYVFYVDADERLVSLDDLREFVDFMDDNQYSYGVAQIDNELPEGGRGLHIMPRVFKKGAVRFENVIQEQAVAQGKGYISNVWIEHLGYNLPEEKMQAKYKAREELLLDALDDAPDNLAYQMHLLRIYRAKKDQIRYQGLCDDLIARDDLSQEQEQIVGANYILSYMMSDESCTDCDALHALPVAQEFVERFPANIDGWFYLSMLRMDAKNIDGAIEALEQYLILRDTIERVGFHKYIPLDTWGWKALAHQNLGIAYVEKGELIQALSALFLARAMNNHSAEIMRQVIGTLLFTEGEIEKYFPEALGEN